MYLYSFLLFALFSSSIALADAGVVACTNAEDTAAYSHYTLDVNESYRVPKGSVAYVDIMLRTLDGPPLVSGIVTRGDKRLTSEDGSDRWYFILAEWDCTYKAPAPKQEV